MLADLQLPRPEPVDLDGTAVATWTLGPDPGGSPATDVVLCHGTPWSATTWARVAHPLSAGRRVRLWDMPGYGASPTTAPVDLATQAERLSHLLARWGGPPPHVVAHDVGAAVALGAHLLHGNDYASLFLWDAVVLDPWGSAFFDLAATHGGVLARLPAPLHQALVRAYVRGAAVAPVPDDVVDVLVDPWTGDEGAARFYRQAAALSPAYTRRLVTRLVDVRCPVRVGWGANDPWLPVEQAEQLARLLPGSADPLLVPDSGHLVQLERPKAVHQALEQWWATTATPLG